MKVTVAGTLLATVRCCVDLQVALPLICCLLCHCFAIGLIGHWFTDLLAERYKT